MEKKKRLALDVIGQLEDDLASNPLDYTKWNKLIKQVLVKDKEDQIRNTFNKYLAIFKYDGSQWCSYINFEMGRQEFKNVQELFGKCITQIDHVELFRLYVSYVRRVNDVITGGEKARGVVIQAFEFATNRVGIDLKSGDLWADYLDFLKSWTPTASWEHQQKNDLIRKVYKKLLVIPTEKVESLWTTYTRWENEVNSSTSSRFIADKSAEFMEARSWNVEWTNALRGQLKREVIPLDISNDSVKIQVGLWNKWIDFEKQNKLQLKEDTQVQQRVEYVHKQAVMSLPFVPEIWYSYVCFLKQKEATSTDLLVQSLILNPKSYLLSFELSESYEKENNVTKANTVLQNLINNLTPDHDSILATIDSINDRSKIIVDTPEQPQQPEDDEDDVQPQRKRVDLSSEDMTKLKLLTARQKELAMSITIVYTKLMMTNKRANGIKESRQMFKQAKKFPQIGHELYVANGLMEYYSDNRNVAKKVFELGMKTYGFEGGYLVSYLDFLIMVNEVDNIKVMFETGINNLTSKVDEDTLVVENLDTSNWEKEVSKDRIIHNKNFAKSLFVKYSKFATEFLDLGIVTSLEGRYKQLFPEDDPIDFLSSRYRYNDIYLVQNDLGKQIRRKPEQELEEPETKKQKTSASSGNGNSGSSGSGSSLPSRPTVREPETPVISREAIQQQQAQGFIGNSVYSLLRILPNSSYFGPPQERVFNSKKLVELFNSIDLPN